MGWSTYRKGYQQKNVILKILVKKSQWQSSASSSPLVSPEFRSKTGVFAGAVNVSMEGSPHLVTLLLSPFTQSQPHPSHRNQISDKNQTKNPDLQHQGVSADFFRIAAGSFCFCRWRGREAIKSQRAWWPSPQSPQAGNQGFLRAEISYHFNFHSRRLFARKSQAAVIAKSKYCLLPPTGSQSHVCHQPTTSKKL